MKTVLAGLASIFTVAHGNASKQYAFNGPWAGEWTFPTRYPNYLSYIDSGDTCVLNGLKVCVYNNRRNQMVYA
jgi:hypothetical protein